MNTPDQLFIAQCRYGNIENLIPIKTPVYIASLPVAHITQDLLIVHRDIFLTGTAQGYGWKVTHAETGFFVAYGKTRKQAMENATAKLLSLPASDSYQRAIDNARRMLAEYKTTH